MNNGKHTDPPAPEAGGQDACLRTSHHSRASGWGWYKAPVLLLSAGGGWVEDLIQSLCATADAV